MSDQQEDIQHLRECLRQRERELEAVRRITFALHAKTSLDDLVRDTLNTAVEVVDAMAGSVLLHDPETDELVFRYVIGEKAEVLTGWRMRSTEGVVGSVFRSGQGEITVDAPADPRFFNKVDSETQFRTRNMVTVPLKRSTGRPLGVMQILNKQRGMFTETDRAVLEILSSQAASAIETASLYEEAKLAFVAKTIGNISHDIVNMLQPSEGALPMLQASLEAVYDTFEALQARPDERERWDRLAAAIREVREFFPEFSQWFLDGAEDVRERARQIVEAVRGEISPPEFRSTRATEVVERILRSLALPARRAGVELRAEAPPDLPPADLDGRALYNALYNLVDNAVDATPAGGTVTISLAAAPDGAAAGGGELRIAVADTGSGMPPGVREQIFTDRIVTTKLAGTGLGTKIVKRVVALHRGTMQVESAEGRGTTITLRLPMRQASAPPARA